jgi:hypothetical protein
LEDIFSLLKTQPKTQRQKKKKPNNHNKISTEYEVQRGRLTAKPFFKEMVARKEDDGP